MGNYYTTSMNYLGPEIGEPATKRRKFTRQNASPCIPIKAFDKLSEALVFEKNHDGHCTIVRNHLKSGIKFEVITDLQDLYNRIFKFEKEPKYHEIFIPSSPLYPVFDIDSEKLPPCFNLNSEFLSEVVDKLYMELSRYVDAENITHISLSNCRKEKISYHVIFRGCFFRSLEDINVFINRIESEYLHELITSRIIDPQIYTKNSSLRIAGCYNEKSDQPLVIMGTMNPTFEQWKSTLVNCHDPKDNQEIVFKRRSVDVERDQDSREKLPGHIVEAVAKYHNNVEKIIKKQFRWDLQIGKDRTPCPFGNLHKHNHAMVTYFNGKYYYKCFSHRCKGQRKLLGVELIDTLIDKDSKLKFDCPKCKDKDVFFEAKFDICEGYKMNHVPKSDTELTDFTCSFYINDYVELDAHICDELFRVCKKCNKKRNHDAILVKNKIEYIHKSCKNNNCILV